MSQKFDLKKYFNTFSKGVLYPFLIIILIGFPLGIYLHSQNYKSWDKFWEMNSTGVLIFIGLLIIYITVFVVDYFKMKKRYEKEKD